MKYKPYSLELKLYCTNHKMSIGARVHPARTPPLPLIASNIKYDQHVIVIVQHWTTIVKLIIQKFSQCDKNSLADTFTTADDDVTGGRAVTANDGRRQLATTDGHTGFVWFSRCLARQKGTTWPVYGVNAPKRANSCRRKYEKRKKITSTEYRAYVRNDGRNKKRRRQHTRRSPTADDGCKGTRDDPWTATRWTTATLDREQRREPKKTREALASVSN